MRYIILLLFLALNLYCKAYKRTICDTVNFDGEKYLMKSDILSSFLFCHKLTIPEPDVTFINDDRNFTASYEVKENNIFLTGIYILRRLQNDSLKWEYQNVIQEVFGDVSEVEMKRLNGVLILVNQINKNINYQLNFQNSNIYNLKVRNGLIQCKHRINRFNYKILIFNTYRKFKSTNKYEELRKYYSSYDDELFKRIILDDVFEYSVNYD